MSISECDRLLPVEEVFGLKVGGGRLLEGGSGALLDGGGMILDGDGGQLDGGTMVSGDGSMVLEDRMLDGSCSAGVNVSSVPTSDLIAHLPGVPAVNAFVPQAVLVGIMACTR